MGFLGFGVQPPAPEWGAMLLSARDYMLAEPTQMIFPALAVLISVLAINLVGDVLRDALAEESADL